MRPFAGQYRITRQLELDECGGRIVGRAKQLTVDADRRLLYTDSVGRGYAARVEGERLIAERRFNETACPDSTHFARWTFQRTGEGALVGTVESQWLLPPNCSAPCVVRFHILATPLP
jgi:hypothetical protein